jgi:hypothetical protein
MDQDRPAHEPDQRTIEIDPELPISAALARSLRRRDAETNKLLCVLQSFERANYELHDQHGQEPRDRRPGTQPRAGAAEPSDTRPTTINIDRPGNVFLDQAAGPSAGHAQPPADAPPQPSPGEQGRLELPLPVYIAQAYEQVASALAEADATQSYDAAHAASRRLEAARHGCAALQRLCSDDRFRDDLGALEAAWATYGSDAQATLEAPANNEQFRRFWEQEQALLMVAGLPRWRASELVDEGVTVFQERPHEVRGLSAAKVLEGLQALRVVACNRYEDYLQELQRTEQSAKHAQRRTRLWKVLAGGVGGGLVIAVNSVTLPATALFAVMSGHLGAGMIGVSLSELANMAG